MTVEAETICLSGDPGTIAFALPKGWAADMPGEDSLYAWVFTSPDGLNSVYVALPEIEPDDGDDPKTLQKSMMAYAIAVLARAKMSDEDSKGDFQREPDGYHVWSECRGEDRNGTFVAFTWAKVLDMGDRGVERPEIYFAADGKAADAAETAALKQHFEAELNSIADQLRGKRTFPAGIGPAVPWREAKLRFGDGSIHTCMVPLGWITQLGSDHIWWFEDTAHRWRHELDGGTIGKVTKRELAGALDENVAKAVDFAQENLRLDAPPKVDTHKNGRRVEITFRDEQEGRPQVITRWYAFITDGAYIRLHRQTFAADVADEQTAEYAALRTFFAEQTDLALDNGFTVRAKN